MVQTEFSGFFDTSETTTRKYSASDWTNLLATLITSGLMTTEGTHMEVTADGSGMTVSVNVDSTSGVGRAAIEGRWYQLTSPQSLTIADADATNDRIDRVVLRLNKVSTEDSPIKLTVITGTPAASPVAPDIVRTGNIYDLSLAQVYVTAGVSVIAADKITDERSDTSVCGPYYAANQDAQIGSLIARYNSMVANNSKLIAKTTGVINTTYDEKIYFSIPTGTVTVEIRVFGRKPSATVQTHSHGTHNHTYYYTYYYDTGNAVQASTSATEVGSGVVTAPAAFPNGLTLRVNGTDTHGPYGTGIEDTDSDWIDITSEITIGGANYLDFLAATAGCVADIEIRYV
jgi:hypothetical protein